MPSLAKTPSLADRIAANTRTRGPRCTVALVIPKLAPEHLADFIDAMVDDMIPSTAIAAGLTDVGHTVSADSVQRHRRGRCGCAR